jgi:protein O-mannosyl-transferase
MKTPSLPRQQKPLTSTAPAEPEELLSPMASYVVAAVLIAGVFAIYSPALNFQFILDDHRFIADPRLQSPGHLWEYFTSYAWAQVAGGPLCFYRPLFVLWLRLNFVLGGTSPWAWHLLSVAKHVLVAVLLGLLVWKLLRDRVAALIAGTLFALHPAQTESVAWVTVPDPLMSAAVLGTLLLYLRYADRVSTENQLQVGKFQKQSRRQLRGHATGNSSANSTGWIIASAAVCLAALMAKETAVVLPALLFAMALVMGIVKPESSDKPGRGVASTVVSAEFRNQLVSAFRQTVPFLAVTVAYLLLRLNALQGQLSPPTQHLPWSTLRLSWPATLWFYVRVLFWPVRSRAFADPILADSFSLRGVVLPGLGLCCAGIILAAGYAWAWRKARRDLPEREAAGVERALLLGTLLLVLPILLVLNLNVLNPGDFLHGRYTYLPLTGLMLLLASAWHLANKARIVLLFAAGLVAVGFSVLTVRQESAWKDDLTVFTVAHQDAPHNAPVAQHLADTHVQVALALDEEDRCDEAIPIFEQVIQQYPQDWFAWAGRGECLFKLNDLRGAEQSLHRASELSHEPRVTEQWQQLRAKMGLPSAPTD